MFVTHDLLCGGFGLDIYIYKSSILQREIVVPIELPVSHISTLLVVMWMRRVVVYFLVYHLFVQIKSVVVVRGSSHHAIYFI